MSSYRIYFMNHASGHIERASDLEAASDREAVRKVRSLRVAGPLELWCGARKLLRLERPAHALERDYGRRQARGW